MEENEIRLKTRIEMEVEKEIEEKESDPYNYHNSLVSSDTDISLNIDEVQYLEAKRMIKGIEDTELDSLNDYVSSDIPDNFESDVLPEAPVVVTVEKPKKKKSSKKTSKTKSKRKASKEDKKRKHIVSITKDNAFEFIYCYYNSANDEELKELYPDLCRLSDALYRAKNIYLKNGGDPSEITKIMLNGSDERNYAFLVMKENVEMFIKDYSRMNKDEVEAKYNHCIKDVRQAFDRAKKVWLSKYGDEKSLNKLMGAKK